MHIVHSTPVASFRFSGSATSENFLARNQFITISPISIEAANTLPIALEKYPSEEPKTEIILAFKVKPSIMEAKTLARTLAGALGIE